MSDDAAADQATASGDQNAGPGQLTKARVAVHVGHEASTSSEVRVYAVSEQPTTLRRYGDGPLILFNLFKISFGGAS
ncbi:hypothetical protein GCM10018790_30820 [Kitasatospora xanthocidica]|nr:hypothetical protein GCM10018790_30820 [Kitasatospora xanthocidica]